ncbi:MAG TPA: hypothetical protein VGN63_19635 [Flavisolibacter sp.]|jgi:hypothetical protein|nr:hypothetical protein [Flavisolibacter sp.]
METKALKETIELTLHFKDYVKLNVLQVDNPGEENSEIDRYVALMHQQCFAVVSEFIINTIENEKHQIEYFHYVRLMLDAMWYHINPPFKFFNVTKGDDNKKLLFNAYVGSINHFIMTFIQSVEPYYSGPVKLEELADLIREEKEIKALREVLSEKEAEEVNARLLFVEAAGIRKHLEKVYKEQHGKIVNRDIGRALAFLFNSPGSHEYIAGLMPKLGTFYAKSRNNPYSLSSVTTAIEALEGMKLTPSPTLLSAQEKLVDKDDADKPRGKSKKK